MYKFRIKNWGLRKNWGEALARKTLEHLTQPAAEAEAEAACAPLITGARADQLRRLERYVQRKPVTTLPVAILPRPYPKNKDRTKAKLPPRQRQRRLRPATLRAPSHLELPDEILRLLKTFVI